MGPILAFAYGAIAYLTFFGTILYAIGFTSGLAVPKDIDDGLSGSTVEALIINLALLTVFALQHSIMARKPFKRWWTQFVPAADRAQHLRAAGEPHPHRPVLAVAADAGDRLECRRADARHGAHGRMVCSAGSWCSSSTFLINHFELFGLQQVIHNLAGRSAAEPKFRTPFLYKLVRHPLYLGFIIAFWATPTMTVGHLLFAGVTTAYILVAIMLEERDLIDLFGDEYKRYRQRVAMLLPLWPKSS